MTGKPLTLLLVLGLLAGCLGDVPGGGDVVDIDKPEKKDPPPNTVPVDPQLPPTGTTLVSPLRVEVTGTGWLLVTDSKRHMVFRVDTATLLPDQALRLDGTPLAVGMLGDQIFVGVEERQTVEVFDASGRAIGSLGGIGTVAHPSDLAIDGSEGLVFVLDGRARDIKVFDVAARSLKGTIAAGQLHSPAGVAVDPVRREVLVSDYGASGVAASIKIFSYGSETWDGFIGEISGAGTCGSLGCSGGFSRPRGLAVDGARVYVTDAVLAQVLMFDRDSGERVGALGTGDPAVSDLRVPTDVEVDGAGHLFVTSTSTARVVRFRAGGTP
ncbi:MAG: NHL repeat-containing protein [Gemmatimonadota bacterium]|nr:NHL repeat-containing protein [Gemmatimonadota bacterium]MDH3366374.1 NHL repeat-containing protein [Gemmatimonadota bacterium]MDH3477632.1 NHL repeat-containing protein [Gemmatimonadota bacterium]MDH3568547.1 NHL repeat-containing protein [Gemmatimonadota bacterium]MDH5549989.1 NHL repeat-containing protein [Gemmatimonadota bacterium]